MQVVIETRDRESTEVHALAERRLRFVTRRLAWLIARAKVQFSDINGPRGGVDKRCQLEFKTDSQGMVVISAVARDWRSALDTALARASRVLARGLSRGQQVQRLRPSGLDL